MKRKLAPFDGKTVLNTAIIIQKAGDGLSAALTVDPQELHHDDEFHVVLRCKVVKVRFDPVKDTDCLTRVHMADTLEATIIDAEIVEDQLDQQRARIEADRVRREKEKGIERLPGIDDPALDEEADPLGAFSDGGQEGEPE